MKKGDKAVKRLKPKVVNNKKFYTLLFTSLFLLLVILSVFYLGVYLEENRTITGNAVSPGCVYTPGWYNSPSIENIDGTVVPGDYDGDGKKDIAIYKSGNFYTYKLDWELTSLGLTLGGLTQWGYGEMIPVAGDYDKDGRSDYMVYEPQVAKWFLLGTTRGRDNITGIDWGFIGGIPVAGDFNDDGYSDMAIYGNAGDGYKFYIISLEGWGKNYALGFEGTVPVSGDYNGDGRSDLALYCDSYCVDANPAEGKWYIVSPDTDGTLGQTLTWNLSFGFHGGIAIPGDYDGDGADDLNIINPVDGKLYSRSIKKNKGLAWGEAFGVNGQIVSGKYDGDNLIDVGFYNTANAVRKYRLNLTKGLCEYSEGCSSDGDCSSLNNDCYRGICLSNGSCSRELSCPSSGCAVGYCSNNVCLTNTSTCSCSPANLSSCEDNNPCTNESCSSLGLCLNSPFNGTVGSPFCTDNNLCTLEDRCFNGRCIGINKTIGFSANCSSLQYAFCYPNGTTTCLFLNNPNGTCPPGQVRLSNGSCGIVLTINPTDPCQENPNALGCPGACERDCSGKLCGSDGCGGSCGECSSEEICSDGECVLQKETNGISWVLIVLIILLLLGIMLIAFFVFNYLKKHQEDSDNGADQNNQTRPPFNPPSSFPNNNPNSFVRFQQPAYPANQIRRF